MLQTLGKTDIAKYRFDERLAEFVIYYTDANKNIAQLMDVNGNTVAKYEYSPFGIQTSSTGAYAASNPFRFSSEYFDSETQLVYYNYRYYSPVLGKWLSRDSIEEYGGVNLYGFVQNNSINYIDSKGQMWLIGWGLLTGAAVVGGMQIYDAIKTYRDKNARQNVIDGADCSITIVVGHGTGARDKLFVEGNPYGFNKRRSQFAAITCGDVTNGKTINDVLKDRGYPVVANLPKVPLQPSRVVKEGYRNPTVKAEISSGTFWGKPNWYYSDPKNPSKAWNSLIPMQKYKIGLREVFMKARIAAKKMNKDECCSSVKIRVVLINTAGGFDSVRTVLDDASMPIKERTSWLWPFIKTNGGFEIQSDRIAEETINF